MASGLQQWLTVRIVHDRAKGAVTDHDAPMAAGGACRRPLVQPADGNGPAGVDQPGEILWPAGLPEGAAQAQAPEGGELRRNAGRIPVLSAAQVVGIVAADPLPIHGHHCAAGGKALPKAGAAGVVELRRKRNGEKT